MNRFAIILAAGKGSRMKSLREDISKVSFPILNVPLVKYVLLALEPLKCDKIVSVVGFGGKTSEAIVKDESEVVWQKELKGSGHAVMMAAPKLENMEGTTIICCGDTPLLKTETLQAMFEYHEKSKNDLTVMTSIQEDPFGYGRIVKDINGNVLKIVEQKDANEAEKNIKEVNAGVYLFDNQKLFESLKKITNTNASGEYYLTDTIGIFVNSGYKVSSFTIADDEETLGVNDRWQLARAAKIMQLRINKKLALSGVSIDDPYNTYISPLAEIMPDVVIHPNSFVYGNSKISKNAIIEPNTYLENVIVGQDVVVESGTYKDCKIDK